MLDEREESGNSLYMLVGSSFHKMFETFLSNRAANHSLESNDKSTHTATPLHTHHC